MKVDLSHYLAVPTLSIYEASMILSGIEPKECLITLEPGYGPFNYDTSSPIHRNRLSKARTFFPLLKAELVCPDGRLDIVNLVAIVREQEDTHEKFAVSDQPIPFEHFGVSALDLDEPVKTSSIEAFDFANKKHIVVKNPQEHIKKALYEERLVATQYTTVTSQSLAEWANSRGINSIFSQKNEHLSLKEQFLKNHKIEDIPALLDALATAEIPYRSAQLRAALLALKHVIEHGSDKYTFCAAIEDYMDRYGTKFNRNQRKHIVGVLNFMTGKSSGVPPMKEWKK